MQTAVSLIMFGTQAIKPALQALERRATNAAMQLFLDGVWRTQPAILQGHG